MLRIKIRNIRRNPRKVWNETREDLQTRKGSSSRQGYIELPWFKQVIK